MRAAASGFLVVLCGVLMGFSGWTNGQVDLLECGQVFLGIGMQGQVNMIECYAGVFLILVCKDMLLH